VYGAVLPTRTLEYLPGAINGPLQDEANRGYHVASTRTLSVHLSHTDMCIPKAETGSD
jgi:hypothetical protein